MAALAAHKTVFFPGQQNIGITNEELDEVSRRLKL